MGELIVQLMQDILSFCMLPPLNYVIALLILYGIVNIFNKLKGGI